MTKENDYKITLLTQSILSFYGYPSTIKSCISKEEKIMFAYGFFAVRSGISSAKNLALNLSNPCDEEEVENFCRSFFDEYGHHIIPSELDTIETDVMKSLKLGIEPKKEISKSENPRLEHSGSEKKNT